MIDLIRLTYAVAVAEEGSYARGAERVGISQPALSRGIQALEQRYGLRLFTRGRTGSKLTAAGAEFIKAVQRILSQVEAAEHELNRIATDSNALVTFGLGPITATIAMPRLIPELAGGRVTLRIRVEPLHVLQRLLTQGKIDFFISGLPASERLSQLPDDFRVKRVPLTAINVFVRHDHPLLAAPFDRAAMAAYPVGGPAFLRNLLPPALLGRVGIRLPTVEMDDYTTLSALARSSDFLVVAARGLAEVRPDLGLVPLPFEVQPEDVEYGLVSADSQDLSPEARRVATLILDHLAGQMAQAGLPTGQPQP